MRRVVLLALVLALPAVSARADPIIPTIFITGGSLDLAGHFMPFGPLVLRGTRNFSVPDGGAEVSNSLGFGCEPCAPGTSLNLGTFFSELFGTAMVDGRVVNPTFELAMVLGLRFAGATPPAPPIGAEALLSAPFTVNGGLIGLDPPLPPFYEVVGRGTATIHLVPFEGATQLWSTDRVHYEFANATPEPTSFALLGTGLLGLLVRTRRRRTKCRRHRAR